MKILLINYRYFVSGGPERYLFNLKRLLERRGHEIIPFSVRSSRDEPSVYAGYFAPPIGEEDQVCFSQHEKNPLQWPELIARQIYSLKCQRALRALIQDVRPDLAFMIQIQNKLSPSVIDACKCEGLPVVHRLSDYHLLCPRASFYNERLGELCDRCVVGSTFSVVRHRCVKQSLSASLIKWIARRIHHGLGVYKKVDAFICTNEFMKEQMVRGGYDPARLHVIPTFVDMGGASPPSREQDYNTILYIGRLTTIKGLDLLIQAFDKVSKERAELRLCLVGPKEDYDLEGAIQRLAPESRPQIDYYPAMPWESLVGMIQASAMVVIPSLCRDNLPQVLLEAWVCRRAVVVPRIAPFLEILGNPARGGLFYEPGDETSLANAMRMLWMKPELAARLGQEGFEKTQTIFSPDEHYNRLMVVFSSLVRGIA